MCGTPPVRARRSPASRPPSSPPACRASRRSCSWSTARTSTTRPCGSTTGSREGAANSNTSTRVLKKQLEDPGARIIITTIQKLATFISANKGHAIYDGHVVIIFDECHRSQFGDMHTAITKAFKRYHLFGFTGTPIFAVNARSGGNLRLRTTEQAFGERLHTYTIVDAITDKNVLPFRIDYVNTIKVGVDVKDKKVPAIDTERALLDSRRIGRGRRLHAGALRPEDPAH